MPDEYLSPSDAALIRRSFHRPGSKPSEFWLAVAECAETHYEITEGRKYQGALNCDYYRGEACTA